MPDQKLTIRHDAGSSASSARADHSLLHEVPMQSVLEQELKKSKNQWEWLVLQLINDEDIPPGYLISYGRLAELANQRFGLNISPRNTANLRRKLYGFLTHATDVPLHRIAKKGDVQSEYDSPKTQMEDNRRRSAEGSLSNPKWI